ncbi:hypothetical protein EDB85DRAFT_526303 [Lactarius pseudohatsudake]|nr:hypothetical protein EDB85DRAFT_526303 [Lactarius pseudohatsudake]
MVGDFDDNANPLWSLHAKEAKNHDEARIQSLHKRQYGRCTHIRMCLYFSCDFMPSYSNAWAGIVQAGLFSAALTSFIIDRIQGLQVDPAQQMVYYQQQNVALLAQISQQISSIAPHVSIPSSLPPPYPDFAPSSSDVRVNAYWFMSLVFSLSAALLATLVQQWVRNYMHVFQQYSHPLKSPRLRQYLYEGAEGWYMSVVVEFVPGLAHMSLILVSWRLTLHCKHDYWGYHHHPVTVCSLIYIFSILAPILCPQLPFRNSSSGSIWYLMQMVHSRRYLDRAFVSAYKPVSLGRLATR